MAIEAGQNLLHYRLVEKIGEGGMGVVWKAVDTTLDREVAIKILPEAVSADAGRLARFEREAKLLASLNHPNIATVHALHGVPPTGSGQASLRFLAMELVAGEDLAARLQRGPLPPDDALGITRRVAQALEAAHQSGVIHRDLKPANIQITPDGKVKVLDFGLAKAFEPVRSGASADPALSPTLTSAGTVAGVILGTAAYMSPEQARGQEADRRADIWALGCVLFEALTGRPVFTGATVSDTLAAVLRADPDWQRLQPGTPPAVRRLLRRCLEKDPGRRLHDVADARIEIEDAMSGESEPVAAATAVPAAGRPRLPWLVTAVVAAVAVVAVAVSWTRPAREARPRLHVAVNLAEDLELLGAVIGELIAALSPDGRRVAFTARRDDTVRLYLRSLDSPEVVVVPETEAATAPFFSPDGQWIGFFSKGKLRKVSIQGGTPVELAEAPSRRGGSWAADDTIVFAPTYTSGLYRVPAAGGEPQPITSPDSAKNERTHRWPDVLPGGKAAIFTIGTQDNPGYYEDATIAVVELDSGEIHPLIEGGSFARYARTGHLLYSREGSLLAVPFDDERLEVTGPPTLLFEGVARQARSGAVHFAIARDGTLMYIPAATQSSPWSLVWADRTGRVEAINTIQNPFLAPKLSPDGTKAVIGLGGPGDGDVWIHGLERGTSTRLTFDGFNLAPIWTPDGKRIVFGMTTGGGEGVAWKAADGSEVEQLIARDSGESAAVPEAWHPGSDTIVYSRYGGRGGSDIMTISLDDPEPEPRPLLEGPDAEGAVSFSPDGRWMAYCSDESGQYEIYVRPYPGLGGKWQLSTEGGKGPVWSRDGREIFYTDGNRMMVVPVETEPSFAPGQPRKLFELGFERDVGLWPDYDVAPDGKRFLMIRSERDALRRRQLHIVTDFATTLQ